MDNIQQTIEEIIGYIKGIWIKKRFIIVSTWLLCPLTWLYVANMPDVYQSSAKVFADTRSILQPLLRGLALQTNIDQELQLMAKTLLSRPNLEKIARNTDLDIKTKNDAEYQALLNMLKKEIRFNTSGRENIYTIKFEHSDPKIAKRVVEETLTLFVESTLGSNRQGSDTANKFLDSQIAEFEKRLASSEIRLSDFKRKHSDILVQSTGGVYGQLSKLNQELENINLRLDETESRLTQAESAWEKSKTVTSTGPNNSAIETQFDSRIESLRVKLDDLLIKYTDRHPDVIESRSVLQRLETLRESEIANYQKSINTDSPELSNVQGRVGQELVISIQNLKNEIASLTVRKKSYQAKIASLKDKMDLIPQIEAEMVGLNRDYDITKSKHRELLNRRESVLMSQQADLQSDDVQFRVIEPPMKALKPSGPKRMVYYVLILVLGFGSGIAVAFLISQMQPVILRPSQLTKLTGVPVLGTISHANLAELNQIENKKTMFFWASNSIILIGFAGLVVMDIMGYRLNSEFLNRLFEVASQQVRSFL
ncbi:XrtA system polysaccharide chain length determinant [Catenovulum maritimum]|uniref:Chain-length determining protein n=1 Tax=Catenovulum maritimum TaxID=1513271 RepID=A0A0J8GTL3_9ALTE|nr:XrtA system polysaccharide chain length determinant [Catenovulum maritimum]KMT64654.1 chain-length determining protein [Catenovulum maritimum]